MIFKGRRVGREYTTGLLTVSPFLFEPNSYSLNVLFLFLDQCLAGKALVTLGTGETVTGEGRWKDILIAAHNYAIVGMHSYISHGLIRCSSCWLSAAGLEDDGAVQNLKVLNPWRRTDSSEGELFCVHRISFGLMIH